MSSNKLRMLIPTALVLAAAVGLGACGDSTGVGTTQMSVRLTDAAASGDLLEAWVQIDSVWLQGNVSGNQGSHVTLLDSPTELVKISSLDSTTRSLVSDVTVPSGTYAQLRIFVSQGIAVAENSNGDLTAYTLGGATLPAESDYSPTASGQLVCPSCAQSGFKVNLPGGSVKLEGTQKILVLDFDVAQSYGHDAAASDQWVLHPVMSATDFEASGGISGTVTLDQSQLSALPECPTGTSRSVEDFIPTATRASDETSVSSGSVSSDGSYTIDFLAPDSYMMGFEDSVAFDNDTLVFDATPSQDQVTLATGDTATVDYSITAASCLEH